MYIPQLFGSTFIFTCSIFFHQIMYVLVRRWNGFCAGASFNTAVTLIHAFKLRQSVYSLSWCCHQHEDDPSRRWDDVNLCWSEQWIWILHVFRSGSAFEEPRNSCSFVLPLAQCALISILERRFNQFCYLRRREEYWMITLSFIWVRCDLEHEFELSLITERGCMARAPASNSVAFA